MVKARVGVRIKEAVGGKKSLNRSQDLEQLTERYNVFCKKLQALIRALKAQYGAMHHLVKTRLEVAVHLSSLAKGSPIHEFAGQLANEERSSDTVCSYLSVHEALAAKANMYTSKYAQHVIDYAVSWEKVVVARITAGLRKAEQLRVEVDHYQEKVEALRLTANTTMAKGKQIDPRTAERLSRNEQKLQGSKQEHMKFVSDLCTLMEEVTERSWRDLHPLLVKVAQFDFTLADDESKTLAPLNSVVNELKKLAATRGIKAQARLKELDTLDPTMLSTRSDADSDSGTPTYAALENGGGFAGLSLSGPGSGLDTSSCHGGNSVHSSSTYDDSAPPSGAVAPNSMGSFPVAVQSDALPSGAMKNGYNMSRVSSYGSAHSGASAPQAPSTLDMIAISASSAPPPTMDQVNEVFGTSASANRSMPQASRGRNQSQDSDISGYSGASAPPPAAAPPLPPGAAAHAPMGMSNGYTPPIYGYSYGQSSQSSYQPPPPSNSGQQKPMMSSMGPYASNNSPTNSFGAAPSPYGAPSPTYSAGSGYDPFASTPQPTMNGQSNPYGASQQHGMGVGLNQFGAAPAPYSHHQQQPQRPQYQHQPHHQKYGMNSQPPRQSSTNPFDN